MDAATAMKHSNDPNGLLGADVLGAGQDDDPQETSDTTNAPAALFAGRPLQCLRPDGGRAGLRQCRGPVGQPLGQRAYTVLGTDGFGRSEARGELRRFFQVDAENIVLAALAALAEQGQFADSRLGDAIRILGLVPQGPHPAKG